MRCLWFAALAACASPRARPPELPLPANAERLYTIWLGGARVGTATELEAWSAAGLHFERVEELRFQRGAASVDLTTTIAIDADATLTAQRVRWNERGGRSESAAEALREGGWRTSTGAELPAAAVPAELAPLLVRRDGSFAGTLFLPARGFVAGAARIEPVAPGRLVARMNVGGRMEATIDLGRDGMPARVVDGDGVIAIRATAEQAAAAFDPVDVIAATAVPIAGTRCAHCRLVLDGDLALPPVPGQLARPTAHGVELELSRALPGELPPGEPGADRTRDIATLVTAVRERITPDLGAAHAGARDAAAATAGDCTTFALAYAALAIERGIPTRVVTGLRIDHHELVRHRWAASWTGRAWIAVDAAFGAAPAGGELVGLAIHDPDDAGLVAGDAALAAVRGASWTR